MKKSGDDRVGNQGNNDLNSSNIIDEQQLNSMIDMEKNFVIMQYENILQQLNIEFHKILNKNQETEEVVLQKESIIKAQSIIIQEKEDSLQSMEHQVRLLKMQVQDQQVVLNSQHENLYSNPKQ